MGLATESVALRRDLGGSAAAPACSYMKEMEEDANGAAPQCET